eukprot:TRINITY_DN1305_c1_g1_i1.p1 TRINITY_DN1305_c1_g1~~TRINITY_DN1305_c1_g1_i1.p1  ORF type:complete len:170 (-),score=53.31 TRINITY_DN1305_c1_g1_i1:209-718(-)
MNRHFSLDLFLISFFLFPFLVLSNNSNSISIESSYMDDNLVINKINYIIEEEDPVCFIVSSCSLCLDEEKEEEWCKETGMKREVECKDNANDDVTRYYQSCTDAPTIHKTQITYFFLIFMALTGVFSSFIVIQRKKSRNAKNKENLLQKLENTNNDNDDNEQEIKIEIS